MGICGGNHGRLFLNLVEKPRVRFELLEVPTREGKELACSQSGCIQFPNCRVFSLRKVSNAESVLFVKPANLSSFSTCLFTFFTSSKKNSNKNREIKCFN